MGDAVLGQLAGEPGKFKKLAVNPRSGKAEELMDHFGISARAIIETLKSLL